MMSSLPLGKFQPMPRWSTSTPSGCFLPAFCWGLPSQYRDHVSCCDAAFNPMRIGSNSDVSLGTWASRGQFSASLFSSELHTNDSRSPCSVVPFGSKKNAPTVSPAHENPLMLGFTLPASCRPELKTYCSGVPLGKKPPPTVVDPCGSTHTM